MVIRDFFTITSYSNIQEVEMSDQQVETENYGAIACARSGTKPMHENQNSRIKLLPATVPPGRVASWHLFRFERF